MSIPGQGNGSPMSPLADLSALSEYIIHGFDPASYSTVFDMANDVAGRLVRDGILTAHPSGGLQDHDWDILSNCVDHLLRAIGRRYPDSGEYM